MSIDVLVVDDAAVARRLVVRAIEADPEIRALGTAVNGNEALEMLDGVVPDLVTLDLEMPGLDGLATLRLLRRRYPRLPVVVVAATSEKGARQALEALAAGANDFVTKPARVASVEAGLDGLRAQLIPKIKALHGKSLRQQARLADEQEARRAAEATRTVQDARLRRRGRSADAPDLVAGGSGGTDAPETSTVHPSGTEDAATARRTVVPAAAVPVQPAARRTPHPRSAEPAALPPARRVEIVAIGSSTGGPQALETLLRPLDRDLGVPVVLVQHMPPTFTRLLAERLDSICALTVREAAEGDVVRAGEVLVAPGDVHLTLVRRTDSVVVHLDRRPPENHCRPAVDVLFRSVAEVYGNRALGVVLTGMGTDGVHGARALHAAGSPTVVQDEESSVVWGMAGAVAAAGLAQQVLPLTGLPAVLTNAAHRDVVHGTRRASA